jgi:hypothetical protein
MVSSFPFSPDLVLLRIGPTAERRLIRAGDRKQDNDEHAYLGRVSRSRECEIFCRWGIRGRVFRLGRFVDSCATPSRFSPV